MSLPLHHLSIFHAVAETGSVTLGAERLLVSQPAVSKQIKQLERVLQTRLFERHAKGVALTPAGELLANYARRVFALTAEAETALGDLSAMRRGRLTIGASPVLGTYLLPQALVYFRQRFPGVELRPQIEEADALEARLADSDMDFAVTEQAPASPPDLEGTSFGTDELSVIAPPDHPLARKRSVEPQALAGEAFVIPEAAGASPGGQSPTERTLADIGARADSVLALGSTEAVKQAVAAGLGLAVVPRLAIRNELAAGRLREVRVAGLPTRRPLYVVRRRGRHESKAAAAFVCVLKHAVRGTLPKLKLRSN